MNMISFRRLRPAYLTAIVIGGFLYAALWYSTTPLTAFFWTAWGVSLFLSWSPRVWAFIALGGFALEFFLALGGFAVLGEYLAKYIFLSLCVLVFQVLSQAVYRGVKRWWFE